MRQSLRIMAVSAVGALGLAFALGACGAAPAQPHYVSDPNGQSCTKLAKNGYCPGDEPKAPASSGSATPAAARSSPAAAPVTATGTTTTIVFSVSGSGYPSIQYGTDSINDSPPGGYGPLGDGNPLPWSVSMPVQSGALYYYVSAQLEGYGSISDTVTENVTTTYSNGTSQSASTVLATGQASGGYNIADAEAVNF